jgi:hypothetical protein
MERLKKANKPKVSPEKPSHYRNILVTINGGSEPRWVSKSELKKLLEKDVVDTVTLNGVTKQYAKIKIVDNTESLDD